MVPLDVYVMRLSPPLLILKLSGAQTPSCMGAPHCLRHMRQWHHTAKTGSPSTCASKSPHMHSHLRVVILLALLLVGKKGKVVVGRYGRYHLAFNAYAERRTEAAPVMDAALMFWIFHRCLRTAARTNRRQPYRRTFCWCGTFMLHYVTSYMTDFS